MTRNSPQLPHQTDRLFLTDGGIETSLIFLDGIALRSFAAFELIESAEGRRALKRYYRRYADIAAREGLGFVFESATWRASQDWGDRLGYSAEALDRINDDAIALMRAVAFEYGRGFAAVYSGCVGPRGDGYRPDARMTEAEAEAYHSAQVESFAQAGADMVTAVTMTHAEEAIGILRAAAGAGLPAVISFTVETDGRLPTGEPLAAAVRRTDAACRVPPAYYMVNCAHPSHFADVLAEGGDWTGRIRGVRANASRRSHAELDEAIELDAGDPHELGEDYLALRRLLPNLNVLGGCCGTDHRHIEAICHARTAEHRAA